jgi:hypothetical protein
MDMVKILPWDLFGIFLRSISPLIVIYSRSAELVSGSSFDIFTLDKVGFWCEMVLNTISHLGEFSWNLFGRKSIYKERFLVSAI